MTAALFDDLKALALTVPDVVHVDLFNDQIANEADELPYNRPAVFIEFLNARYEDSVGGRQIATVQFTLHIVVEFYHNLYNTTTQQLQAWALKNEVVKKFYDYTSERLCSLKRIEEQVDRNYNNLFVFRQTYELTYYDETTQKRQDWVLEKISNLLVNKSVSQTL